ncbi:putative aldehyde dehydrogenase-like protein [Nakaseomyces bracarensis]|uniref:Aldehyde dehydrogenase-like protein n=1 Tax=Nakaseomyces bracarensis TaxID=273131 RepID=A0ABR4NRX3_9SACH
MQSVYLNSDMVQRLNSTIQDYVKDILNNHYNDGVVMNPRMVMGTTLVASLFTLYVAYKLFASAGCGYKARRFKASTPEEVMPNWKGRRLDPPRLVDDSKPRYIQSYCPATGQYLGEFKSMTTEEIDKLVRNAEEAQSKWANSAINKRLEVLATLQKFILENQDLIARVACRDSGKTMLDASMGEILVTLEKIQWTLKHGPQTLQPSRRPGPTNFFMKFYKGAEIRYEPLGVISSIVSWNYPFHNLMGPIIASIFTGNAIIVKCSEQVVWSSEYFIELVRECLKTCDVDPNIVQLCYCLPPTKDDDAANYFTSHPGIKHITFIGSQSVAKHILNCAAESLTPVVVELGGKDAFIVLDSVKDLKALSSIILRGTFQSSGQNCIGIERVIVSERNYQPLVDILKERMTKQPLRQGSDIDHLEDVDMGAMISDNRFGQLEGLIKDAVSKGAKLIYGGSRYNHPKFPLGHYFQPTLLVDVTPDMDIAQNEVFGPILVMMKARNTQHCIELANSAPFGLGGSVFGQDYNECNMVANKLKTGNVAINDFATFYVCQLPFGGINGSGYGKFGGEEGLLGLCNAKSICFDTLPFISTQIPPPLDYPIKSNRKAWGFVKSFITGSYAMSTWQRIKALLSLAKDAS